MKEKRVSVAVLAKVRGSAVLCRKICLLHHNKFKKVTLFCILILEIEAFCGRTVDAILSYTVDLLLASDPFVVCVCHY